ncbi:MAG: hypothetical protein U1F25_02285 [Rubrivivax sp.]
MTRCAAHCARANCCSPANRHCCRAPRAASACFARNGRFAAVGLLDEVRAQAPGLPLLALPQTLLMPGFVDAHHHLTQSFGKALAFGESSRSSAASGAAGRGSLDPHGCRTSPPSWRRWKRCAAASPPCDAGVRSVHG